MERNKILKYGNLLTKAIYWFMLIIMAVFTIGLIIWLINPNSLSSILVIDATDGGFNDVHFKFSGSEGVALSDFTTGMIFWLYFRVIFFSGITLLISRKILAILSSIEKLQTFYSDNIEHFRDLARIGFIAFIVSCINLGYVDGVMNFNFKISVGPLIFSVACLVLSEVFREGKNLLEENRMIV